jgi:cytochrome P450
VNAAEIDWWTLFKDPAHLVDPYPELKRIRELAPIHHDSVSGVYFVLGYREFGRIARAPEMRRDTRLWTDGWHSPQSRQRDSASYRLYSEFQPQMTNTDGADHRRMRSVYEKAFRPGTIARYQPMVEALCRPLLDELPTDRPVEFMSEFARLLPHRVTRSLFELPPAMDDQLAQWIAALNLIGSIIMTAEQKRDAQAALREFKDYLRGHLASRRAEPGDGFIGIALAAFEDGTLDEDETLVNLVTLVSGGSATPTLLGSGMLALLKHPAQFARLRADRDLLRAAIEEMLRYEPGGNFILRVAASDFQCGEVRIPAGSLAIGLTGAINRDPARFDDPDRFDIGRRPNPHSVFGGGPHICLGAALVRMTAQVAFTAFMDRYRHIELACDPVWWIHRSDQRGLLALPLQLEQA